MTYIFRHICSGLTLLALLTAAALPAGFMPNLKTAAAGQQGLAPIVLCTASGLQTIYVPQDQAPTGNSTPDTQQPHDPHTSGACPYALLAAAADIPQQTAYFTHALHGTSHTVSIAVQPVRQKYPQKYIHAQAPPLA